MALVSVVESRSGSVLAHSNQAISSSSSAPHSLVGPLGRHLNQAIRNAGMGELEGGGMESGGRWEEEEEGEEESPSSSDNSSKKSAGRPNRDPLSHRIIEKRRRDRMNNCLTNLSKLIPSTFLKKGRGRIEKTEIIEMAIRYMKQMQDEARHLPPRNSKGWMADKSVETEAPAQSPSSTSTIPECKPICGSEMSRQGLEERYRQGFFDCMAETLKFFVAAEGVTINQDSKTRLLLHLKDYFARMKFGTLGPSFPESLQVATPPVFPNVQTLQNRQSVSQKVSLLFNPPLAENLMMKSEEDGGENTDQPLNMSLKRRRSDSDEATPSDYVVRRGSQLRDILTEAKESGAKGLVPSQSNPVPPKRPLVFRYNPSIQSSKLPEDQQRQRIYEASKTMEGPALLLAAAEHNAVSSFYGPLDSRTPPSNMDTLSAGNSNSSSHYPSSPGSSSRSFSGGSTASYHGDSPPRVLSPPLTHQPPTPHNNAHLPPTGIPIFALHPSGFYYVPMTINAGQLEPGLVAQLSGPTHSSRGPGACHPVTITVNFTPPTPTPQPQLAHSNSAPPHLPPHLLQPPPRSHPWPPAQPHLHFANHPGNLFAGPNQLHPGGSAHVSSSHIQALKPVG